MTTTTKRTDELQPGDVITVGPFLNDKRIRTETVTKVEPWILTRGRKAGQQGTDTDGKPLLTIRCESDPADGSGGFGAPADRTWAVSE